MCAIIGYRGSTRNFVNPMKTQPDARAQGRAEQRREETIVSSQLIQV